MAPVHLLLDLEARGFQVWREGDYLWVSPSEAITDADAHAIRRWKVHLLALVSDATHEVM
jgi:hypothetical protein